MTIARISRALRRVYINKRGIALTEFALVTPILIVLGTAGLEMANYANVRMRLSQITMNVADNISRVGLDSGSSVFKLTEGDVNDTFVGARISASTLDVFRHGRVVISSLERNANGGQWIHWQRCMGERRFNSPYGSEGTGATGTSLPGMGPANARVTSPSASVAVMYVEVQYEYQPLFPFLWQAATQFDRNGNVLGGGSEDENADGSSKLGAIFAPPMRTISYGNAYMVRDNRDLDQTGGTNNQRGIFNPPHPTTGRTAPRKMCDVYTAT